MAVKNSFESFRNPLIILCEQALHGDLSIEDFFSYWPKDISQTAFVNELFNDLEECIEHFPAHAMNGEKNFEYWSTSYIKHKINVNSQLLASGLNEDRMLGQPPI